MKDKILKISVLSFVFIFYVTYLPLFSSMIRYYSPNEEYFCSIDSTMSENSNSVIRVKKDSNNKEITTLTVDYTPQEISIDNNCRYVVLIGIIPKGNSIDFNSLPALSIFDLKKDISTTISLDLLITPNRIRSYNGKIYWHDNENTGFLKNDNFFQICTRSGKKFFINLDSLKIENYTKEVELFEMGWDH